MSGKLENYDLKKELGESFWNGMNMIKVSPATSFINGAATNVFTKANATLDKAEQIQSSIGNIQTTLSNGGSFGEVVANQLGTAAMGNPAVAAGANLYNTVSNVDLNVYKNAVMNFAQKIVGEELKNYCEIETGKLGNAILSMPGYVVQRTSYWTVTYIKSVAELTSELVCSIEDVQSDNMKKFEIEQTKEKILQAKNTIGAVKDMYAYTVGSVADGVNSITQYIQNGPEWIEKNLTKYIKNVVLTPVEKWMTKQIDSSVREIYTFADGIAQALAMKAAEVINKAAKWAIQKALILAQKLKLFALNIAKSLLEKAKNLLASTLGLGL